MRHLSIDLLRGFIMLLMAIDHASAFIGRTHYFEIWGVPLIPYENSGWFLTRLVSHLCAPGFFMLMGLSMVILAQNRLSKNWSISEIRKYFWKRGGLILLLMVFVEFPAWGLGFVNGDPGINPETLVPGIAGFGIPTTVLFGLGLCMILGSWLVNWKIWQLLLAVIGSFVISGWYIESMEPIQHFNILEQIFLVPGNGNLFVIYPVIPWIGVTAFGMLLANFLRKHPQKIYKWMLIGGVLFLLAFYIIRTSAWSDYFIMGTQNWISFLTLIKYPPSITFFLFTVGILLILFWGFSKMPLNKITKPIQLFGKTAMFFYLIHLYIYALMGVFFPSGCSLVMLYLFWAIGLIPLYFLCRWYLKFKKGKPENSIWKMI